MIRFFFNRFSVMVMLMDIIGVAAFVLLAIKFFITPPSATTLAAFLVVIAEYAFIRYCREKRWYRDVPRWSGIELQFLKAMVPTSYIMAIAGIFTLVVTNPSMLIISAIFLAVIAHVNVILIYLHRHDTDQSPVNFFSSGAFKIDAK